MRLFPCHLLLPPAMGAFSVFSQNFLPTYGKILIIHYSNVGWMIFQNTIHVAFILFHMFLVLSTLSQRGQPSFSVLGMGWQTEHIERKESMSGFWFSETHPSRGKGRGLGNESWETIRGAIAEFSFPQLGKHSLDRGKKGLWRGW